MAKTSVREMLAERAAEKSVAVPEVDSAYAAMFGLSSETRKNQMTEIPLAALVPYSKHPFENVLAGTLKGSRAEHCG